MYVNTLYVCVRKVLDLYCDLVLTKVYSNPQTHNDFYFANLIKPLEMCIDSITKELCFGLSQRRKTQCGK